MTCRGQSLLHSCFRVHEGPAGHPGRRRLAAAETCQKALRNHPSWESDGDAKRAFGPVMSKWLASGVLEYVAWDDRCPRAWDDRMPTLLQPCGAAPLHNGSLGTAPLYATSCTPTEESRTPPRLRGGGGRSPLGGRARSPAAAPGPGCPGATSTSPWSYRTRITWRFGPGAAASGGWSSGRSWCPGARAGPTRCRGGTRWSGPDQLARRPPAEVAATRSCAAW